MGDVEITLPTGEAATVPQGDLQQALAAGARVRDTSLDEARGTAGTVASFGTGLGDALSGGLYTRGLAAGAELLGGREAGEQTIQAVREVQEANPYAKLGGEAAGIAVGMGAGLGEAGAALEGRLAVALEGSLGRVGARVAGYTVRGAAENTFLSLEKAVREEHLGDPRANAEKVFHELPKDALIGALAGGALGLGSEGLGAARSLLARTRPTGLADDVAAGLKGMGGAVRRDAHDATTFIDEAGVRGLKASQASDALRDLDAIANARATAQTGRGATFVDDAAEQIIKARAQGNREVEDLLRAQYKTRAAHVAEAEVILDKSTRSVTRDLDEVLKHTEPQLFDAAIVAKKSHMGKLVEPERWREATEAALDVWNDTKKFVEFYEGTATKGGAGGALKKMRNVLDDFSGPRGMGPAAMAPDKGERAAALFNMLDDLKRTTGNVVNRTGGAEASFTGDIRTLYEKMRTTLENDAAWGTKAAGAQREVNAAISGALGTRDKFADAFATTYGKVGWDKVNVADPGKVKGFLNAVGGAESDLKQQALRDYAAGMRNRMAAVERHYELSVEQATSFAKGRAALDRLEGTLDGALRDASVVQKLKQMRADEGSGIGGTLGFFTDFATRPLTTMDRLAQLRRVAEKADAAIDDGIARFVRGNKVTEAAVAKLPSRAELVEEIGRVRELARNPTQLVTRARDFVGDLSAYAPKHAAALGEQAMRTIAFLASHAPEGRTSHTIAGPGERKYTDDELDRYARVRQAAMVGPRDVLASLSSGRLARDKIEALKLTSPQQWASLQQRMFDHVQKLAADGTLEKIPYERRVQIAALFEFSTDDTTRPAFLDTIQTIMQPPPGPGGAPPPTGVGAVPASHAKRPMRLTMPSLESARLQAGGTK